jgi:predicted Zn-dependent protease
MNQAFRSVRLALCLAAVLWLLVKPSKANDLPDFQTYALPDRLASAVMTTQPGDYADRVDSNPVGRLIWTQFPVKVFLDTAGSKALRESVWLDAVRRAIADWNEYLPLVEVFDSQSANITVRRASVPIKRDPTGRIQPIRFAETKYAFYVESDRLQQHMTVLLSPNQPDLSLLAGARHELGHALGIWGHSDRDTDVMYFSQVAHPAGITDRDVNTLRHLYGEPTRLGGLVGKLTP